MGPDAIAKISETTYLQLRKLAYSVMRGERRAVTLSPTVLLHEALLRWKRIVGETRTREHEDRVLRVIMRHLLVDYVRRRALFAEQTAAEQTMDRSCKWGTDSDPEQSLSMKHAMSKLAKLDQRQATIVEMRVLGGLTLEEIGEQLGCCVRTVGREWATAQLWLRRELRNRGD